jgi:prophage maintenance system killer protein
MIISIGYRINSVQATQFRIWATQTLKQHLVQGYTINKKLIGRNYEKFMQAVSEVKALLPPDNKVKTEDILELINAFAQTWVSLDAYDTNSLPQNGLSEKDVVITTNDLRDVLLQFKAKLVANKQASNLFAQETKTGSLEGIIGAVYQSASGKDVYATAEEKAAHLLYFIVKNHPFIDGNKRSGAFAFVWFLRKTKLLRASLTPEALTALTLLIAESNPKDKPKMIGLLLMLLK